MNVEKKDTMQGTMHALQTKMREYAEYFRKMKQETYGNKPPDAGEQKHW